MRIRNNELARSVSDDVLQHSSYSTPVARTSGGLSVLTRLKHSQRQEPDEAPYLTNSPTSMENEGSPVLFEEVSI